MLCWNRAAQPAALPGRPSKAGHSIPLRKQPYYILCIARCSPLRLALRTLGTIETTSKQEGE